MKKATILIVAVSVLLALALFGAGQEAKPPMKQALIALNYVHPVEVARLISPYTSPQARTSWSDEQKILTISDFPENIEKVLSVIREIDIKPADVMITVQLILASEDGEAKTDEALVNDPIIKELKGFLKYKSFSLLDTALVRAIGNGARSSELTMGPKGDIDLEMSARATKDNSGESIQISARLKKLSWVYGSTETTPKGEPAVTTSAPRQTSQTLIESNLTLKSGDKTVVGVSRTAGGDRGLILIIQAKVVG